MDAHAAPAVEPMEDVVIPEGESDDEYQVLSKKPKNIQRKPSPEVEPVRESEPTVSEAVESQDAAVQPDKLQDAPADEAGPVSDADWLRSRTNRVLDLVVDDDIDDTPQPTTHNNDITVEDEPVEAAATLPEVTSAEEVQGSDAEPSEEDKVRQTGRLFLRNLHYDVTEDDIREQFAKFGSLEEVGFHSFFSSTSRHMMNIQDRDN